MLNEIGWLEKYNFAKKYYEYYGDLEISKTFKTKDGINYDKDGICLGVWINYMRESYKKGKLSKDRYELMSKIGMRFDRKKSSKEMWLERYQLAKTYFEYYKNLNIKYSFKTKDGINYDEDGFALGRWIVVQRSLNTQGILNNKNKEMLEDIGMNFEVKEYDFGGVKHYELAKKYYEHYHDLEVPAKFKTKDGINYDEDGLCLGFWVGNQRVAYNRGNLSQEMIDKLSKIGMRFDDIRDINWDKMYELAKRYYEKYNNWDINFDFKTKDGINYEKDGFSLGLWIRTQRTQNKNGKLKGRRKQLLDELNFNYNFNIEEQWQEIYNLAYNYFYHYGNLEIKREVTTKNGYDYNKDGIRLGAWINTQRYKYSKGLLEQEKIDKLNLIGMVWNMRDRKCIIKSWCNLHNINYDYNKDVLLYISYQELESKRLFLESINEPLKKKSGKLHKIFSMSNINMQVEYNISLEEIMNTYNKQCCLRKIKGN